MRLISPSVLPMSFAHSPLAVDATVLDEADDEDDEPSLQPAR